MIDDLALAGARIRSAIPQDHLDPGRRIAIYGAGFLGEWAIRWLRENGIEPIACFDGNSSRHNTQLLGVPIEGPSNIGTLRPDLILITARHAVGVISAMLDNSGVKNCSLEAFVAASHFERFREIHDLALGDDFSRFTLRAVLTSMLTGDPTSLHDVFQKDQYFCLPRFAGSENEIYVDAGAYVGDSVERFIWAVGGAFSSIHAFEPGERQFAALQTRAARLVDEWALPPEAMQLNRVGLSDRSGSASTGSASGQLQSLSITSESDGTVQTSTLDEYLGGAKATFIKADVEGMELALLRGSAQTISRWKPKLAICVYHYPLDLLDVVAYVGSLVPEYRFALRHHSPRQLETVLYCWTD